MILFPKTCFPQLLHYNSWTCSSLFLCFTTIYLRIYFSYDTNDKCAEISFQQNPFIQRDNLQLIELLMFRWEPNKNKSFRHSFLKCTWTYLYINFRGFRQVTCKHFLKTLWDRHPPKNIPKWYLLIDSRSLKVGSPVLSNICIESYLEWVVLAQLLGRVFTTATCFTNLPRVCFVD